jgi:hypothetical protein
VGQQQTKAGLLISGEEETQLSSKHFGLINLTIENQSDQWKRVRNVRISFGGEDADSKAQVLVGKGLASWAEAVQHLDLIHRHNRGIVLASLALAGALVAGAGAAAGENIVGGVALGASLGAASALKVTELGDRVRDLENPSIVPANHLLAGELEIPPKLFVRRFLVVDTSNPETPRLEKLRLTYDVGDETEVVELAFRNGESKWQKWGRAQASRYLAR